jgi:hypothetical protein
VTINPGIAFGIGQSLDEVHRTFIAQGVLQRRDLCLLFMTARQLPETQAQQQRLDQQGQQQQRDSRFHPSAPDFTDNGQTTPPQVNPMQKLLIIAFVILILWNLGAGLYYMMVDKGKTDRTVKSLSWRIGLSVLLILLVIAGIFTGVIKPHGIHG